MHVSVWGEICATRRLNLNDVFCDILVVGGEGKGEGGWNLIEF